jgi:hypothetical protein
MARAADLRFNFSIQPNGVARSWVISAIRLLTEFFDSRRLHQKIADFGLMIVD